MTTRQKAIVRFALDFLKANVESLEEYNEDDDGGMLAAFGGNISGQEIEELKNLLGVTFS